MNQPIPQPVLRNFITFASSIMKETFSTKKRMKHKSINSNKQFMIGNGILAFGVFFVVCLFLYLAFRQQNKEHKGTYEGMYTIELTNSFAGDSIAVYINDSLLLNRTMPDGNVKLQVARFAEHLQTRLLLQKIGIAAAIGRIGHGDAPVRDTVCRKQAAAGEIPVKIIPACRASADQAMIRRIDGIEIGPVHVARMPQPAVRYVGVDDRHVVHGLHERREIVKIFGIRVRDPVSV